MNSTKLEIEHVVDSECPISSLVGALNPPMARFSFEKKQKQIGVYEKWRNIKSICDNKDQNYLDKFWTHWEPNKICYVHIVLGTEVLEKVWLDGGKKHIKDFG